VRTFDPRLDPELTGAANTFLDYFMDCRIRPGSDSG